MTRTARARCRCKVIWRVLVRRMCAVAVIAGGVGGVGVATTAGTSVAASGPLPVVEFARLHLVRRHETTVSEQGTGSGTFSGPITLRIEAEEEALNFSFRCVTRSGEVVGVGQIRLHVANPQSTFTGSVSLSRGTGRYSNVQARDLVVTGTVVTSDYATTLHARGSMRL